MGTNDDLITQSTRREV